MGLIIQIILTVVAWKRGWEWYSLIPITSAFFIGLMIGMSGGVNTLPIILIDILSMIALIVMVIVKPKKG